ncbi:flagellar protein FlgN [Paenibacillus aestuarii]|uniref:Flagellar protein FlgN n=1 Tax=Paenibacillus aestuarii TaxID=516965 RepID=A0ABW0K7L3_9BACL|nr:flagellar protein FlgN [Paenibacillus aestuarii]
MAALIEVLEQLIELHQALLQLGKDKTPVLVKNEVDKLSSIVQKEKSLVKKVEELDRKRVQLIGEYLISRGYNPDPRIRISDLVKVVFKAEEKKALIDVQARLLESIRELQKQNEMNQKLVEQSLAFINYTLDLFVKTPEQDAFYQRPQAQQPQHAYNTVRSGLFDTKA